jgi:hypothetical protein
MIKQVFNDSAKNIYDDFIKKMSNYFSLKNHNHKLVNLTDVNLTGATQGDYISYDNGIWVPTSGSSSDLSNYYTKQQSNENFLSGNTTISDLDGYTKTEVYNTGQTYTKTEIEQIIISSGSTSYDKKYDYVSPYSYCGVGPKNSLETDSVWKITRIEILQDGTNIVIVKENVKWSERYILIYN